MIGGFAAILLIVAAGLYDERSLAARAFLTVGAVALATCAAMLWAYYARNRSHANEA